MSTGQMRAPARRVVLRLAEVACSGEVRQPALADRMLADFDALLVVLPTGTRRLLRAGLAAFNQGSRLYPPARGRKFATLSDDRAEAYYLAVKRGRLGPGLQLIKGPVVFSYYELPEVRERLGYRPDAYIAAVSRRRLDSYAAQIRAGEAAALARRPAPRPETPAPDTPGPGAPGPDTQEPDTQEPGAP